MARFFVALLLALVCGGAGYYFGFQRGVAGTNDDATMGAQFEKGSRPDREAKPARLNERNRHAAATTAEPLAVLGDRKLGVPIANLRASDILDTFDQARGGGERRHEATDIMAPLNTPVLAVDDGVIRKLFTSKPGGLTIYQYDPGERFCYYYAHLDHYAPSLKEGQQVRRGDVIGYVGSTGNADPNAPHLHFAILQLGPFRDWWRETVPVNPYPVLIGALTGKEPR